MDNVEYKAVLFDMDGTLTDTLAIHFNSLNDALLEHGGEYRISEDDWKTRWAGFSAIDILAALTEERGLPVERHAWILRRKTVFTLRRIERHLEPDFKKVALLQSLRQRDVKIAVCSNANRAVVDAALAKTGLTALVDVVLAREDVKNPKPDPEIYQAAAHKLGLPTELCIVVEDSELGKDAARAAQVGMLVEVEGPNDVTEVLF